MEEKKVDTEEFKKETVDTVNQVKDTIKNVDIKKDAKEATGFISEMFKDPFAKIKEIVEDKQNKSLKIAIIFVVIWVVAIFIKALAAKYWSFDALFRNILSLGKTVVAPVLNIIVLSGIVYVMNKKEKKPFANLLTSITIAKIPVILASVVSLLVLFSSSASRIVIPFTSLCTIISIVLTYFTIKAIFKEEQNSKFFKTFVIIEGIYYIAYILISFLEIYI